MASSYYTNTLHVSFESVLAMDNPGMVSMFKALTESSLQGFLGCPVVIYEAALIDIFENALVRDGVVISIVAGKLVEISEELFAETFELPVEGLTNLSEIPKDLVFDAKSIVSLIGEPVSMSGKKKEMKIEFRLLCDIMAKTIFVKAGSFDPITQEKFLMIAGITCGVESSAGEHSELGTGRIHSVSSSKILTEKTVHRYIILNEKVGGEDVTDAPRVKRTPVKRAVSKKRPAAVDAEPAPIVKKKRTTKSKAVSSKDTLDTLPVEAVPLQMIAPNTVALTEQLPVPKRPTQKRKRRLILGSDDEIIDSEPVVAGVEGEQVETAADSASIETIVESVAEPVSEPAVADVVNEGPSTTDDVDDIIQQVLTETAQIGVDKEEIDGGGETVDRPVETASDIEDEMDSYMGNQVLPVVGGTYVVLGTTVGVQTEASPDENFLKESLEAIEEKLVSTDEAMSLEDILMSIPVDVPLPSTGVEVTKITVGKSIKIPGVDERTWYMVSLPHIPVDDKGKKTLPEKDPVNGNPVKEQFLLIVADIDLLVQLREQIIDEVAKFFYSFSLKSLANLKLDDSYYAKEELVFSWAEAESTGVALQRRMYILLKYRELLIRKFLEARKINFAPGDGSSATDLKILDCLSYLHLFVLEELKEQSPVHGLRWDKTCFSKIFEGRNRDRGAVIARSNTNTKSSCWIRTMLRVDGTCVIEPCAGYWKPIPIEVTSSMVVIPSRLPYVDTLPPMSEFSKLLKKRWGDVCIEVAKFFASGKLLPKVRNQVGAASFDVVDVRRVVKELDTKVATVATGLDDVRKDVEATKEAISHQILDFRAQAQENYNILTAQLSELVAYVNRGGNDKNGEDISSRGPQPPPDDQDRPTREGSANREAGIRGGVDRNRGGSGSSGIQSRGNRSEPTKRGDLVMSRRSVVLVWSISTNWRTKKKC
ncbi:hypothetical protein F511_19497 [Dorcoceras hygrometricum]|uniref:Dystroglycan-like n=1 Tax=Dorcoceras hygrometricum TaxID=472368 RepID=A0A2Z7C9G6_9LAMI|nr:hypothetical protein F511_19497 [Dorcoceras hygrometricum]